MSSQRRRCPQGMAAQTPGHAVPRAVHARVQSGARGSAGLSSRTGRKRCGGVQTAFQSRPFPPVGALYLWVHLLRSARKALLTTGHAAATGGRRVGMPAGRRRTHEAHLPSGSHAHRAASVTPRLPRRSRRHAPRHHRWPARAHKSGRGSACVEGAEKKPKEGRAREALHGRLYGGGGCSIRTINF